MLSAYLKYSSINILKVFKVFKMFRVSSVFRVVCDNMYMPFLEYTFGMWEKKGRKKCKHVVSKYSV